MWQFRRPPESLSTEEREALEELFEQIPELEYLHSLRWGITDIFERAPDRDTAEADIEEFRQLAQDTEFAEALEEFFGTYDRWKEGILAYFDDRHSSGVVEGINNKARVITKRTYGVKTAQTLRTRLELDLNRAAEAVRYTVDRIHELMRGIKTTFCGYYT